ncbi:MAG TPA: threonine/serine dehydratase [Candidatus Saccharimonadales bacterium]|jgi:threonine dehydratase|nr:threonine/serine dehydratase [Candidatus Saccharimonadales bacterium]
MTVGLADAERARPVIAEHILRTPLVSSHSLGERIGAEAYLKLENLQRTGSFKVRGAVYAMSRLAPRARAAGVVTMSAGNAAQAIAYAGRAQGVRVTVVMPDTAPQTKIAATRGYGAEIRFAPDMTQLLPMVQELQAKGLHFLHPFDDDDVIAGHASLGIEILEDLPLADLVVVGVGGGGLISGVALAVRALRPGARIVGVEPEGAPGVRRALDAGHAVRLDSTQTVADGLAAPFAGERNLEIIKREVDDVVLISDDAILDGLRFLIARARIVAEPAGAAAVGALLCGAVKPRTGERVVAIVSGGNVDPERLAGFLA